MVPSAFQSAISNRDPRRRGAFKGDRVLRPGDAHRFTVANCTRADSAFCVLQESHLSQWLTSQAWLADLDYAYNGIFTFSELITDAFVGLRSELPHWLLSWPQAAPFVAPSEKLVFHGETFSSPGFWEVFSKLIPLEVIRQYLNDRQEHRKDRESAERTRLALENERLSYREAATGA